MRRKFTLLFMFLFGLVALQAQICPPYAPAPDCASAMPDCANGLDGYCNTLGTDPNGSALPGCNGNAILNNDEWIAFFAGSQSITVEIVPSNCQGIGGNGNIGMQAGFYSDCNDLNGSVLSVQCNCTQNNIILNSNNFVIGQVYYIVMDGCGGDICDYEINVTNGLTSLPAPPNPTMISGPTNVCPGQTATYTTDNLFSIVNYDWQVSGGTVVAQTGNTITVTWGSSGSLSVFGTNGCYQTTAVNLNVTATPLPPTDDFGEYCDGASYIYPGNGQSYTEGDHTITFTGANGSYVGCDSTVILHVTENPNYFIEIYRTICDGEDVTIAGVPYTSTGTYPINLTTMFTGCDSTIFLDLIVLNPEPNIQPPADLGCTLTQTLIDGSQSMGDSYDWASPDGGFICAGNGSPVITVCAAGTYCLTVTSFGIDQGVPLECTEEMCVTVQEVIDPPVLGVMSTDVTCPGEEDGTATVAVNSGGVGPFIYIWNTSPLQSGTTASGLEGGSYTVTVTGFNGCTEEISVLVEESTPMTLTTSFTDTDCNGTATGTATVSATGGSGGYGFAWNTSPVQNNATATGLAANTYTVVVTDSNGCTQEEDVTVGQPVSLTAITSAIDADCNGSSTGSASVTASGGDDSFTYIWSTTPVQNDPTATGLAADTYTVTVTDGSGCSIIETAVVGQPAALAISVIEADVSCASLADGTATASATGGDDAFTYVWSTTPAQNNATATGLAADTYTVTATDGNGCSITETVIIDEPTGLTVVNSFVDVSCNSFSDGSATVAVSGGAGIYTYIWSTTPVQNDATAIGLAADTYTVTIEDDNGCQQIEMITVSEPTAITASTNTTPIDCDGDSNGSASVTASGGTGTLSYSWNTSPIQTTSTATGLAAGPYDVVVTDLNGCSITESVVVGDANALTLSVAHTDTDCNSGMDGTATATAGGGTGALSYSWNTSPVQTTPTATGLAAGPYTVIVTDLNGCSITDMVTVDEPDALTLSVVGNDPACSSSTDGTATATAGGGTGMLSYSWNTTPVQTTPTATGLTAGPYTVVVTDLNGCSIMETVNLVAPNALALSTTQVNVACFGENTGSATVIATGGTPPLTYSWDDPASQNTPTAVGLEDGTHTVDVMDANGCIETISVILTEPASALSASGTSTDASCGATNGTIDLTVLGGTAPYTFDWNDATPDIEDPTNLGPGTYSVLVTDFNMCTVTASVLVNTPSGLAASVVETDVTCFGFTDGGIDVTVVGGTAPYGFAWSEVGIITEDLVSVGEGNYSVTVTDADGCSVVASGIISQPDALTAVATASQASCGLSDGGVSLVVSGGTSPYVFDWNGANTDYDGMQSPSNLPPGPYDVVVRDANGCTVTASAMVTVPNGPILTFTVVDADCNGQNTGGIDLEVSGGTAPFTYVWNNGAGIDQDPDNLGANTYDVIVTDDNNCSAVASIVVGEPDAIMLSVQTTDVSCNGANDGTADAIVTGGTAPYNYDWCDGQTGQTAINCEPGNCTLIVTDANGCTFETQVIINEPTILLASQVVVDVDCNGSSTGGIDVTVVGGTSPYTYSWDNGLPADEDQNGVPAGEYDCIVTDANGCTAELIDILVDEPTPISITSTTVDATCNQSNGSIDLDVTGGTSPYTYAWVGLPPVEDPGAVAAGSYEVEVTDANGCTATQMVTVSTPSALTVSAAGTDADCNLALTGSIDVTVTGGNPPFTFAWDNTAQVIEDPINLGAGIYTVTVTDSDGCTVTAFAGIAEPTAIVLSASSTDATCNQNNGSIDLDVTGGTAPYTFAWSGGADPQEDPDNLGVGNYDVTVSDANGCTEILTTTVSTPSGLSASATGADASCFTVADGSIELMVVGGNAPYTFAWDGGLGIVEDPTSVPAGVYNVVVTDTDGCTVVASATVNEPALLTASGVAQEATCGDANGSIDLTVVGGTAPYTFAWDGGLAAVEDPGSALAGGYNVMVTDANGCTTTASVNVSEPAMLSVSSIGTNALCFNEASGTINATVVGGTAPFTFSWDNTPQDIEDPIDLLAGTYTLLVTDVNGCTATTTAFLGEPTALTASGTSTDATCGDTNGTIDLNPSGGTAPYTFTWSGGADPQEDPDNLGAGSYNVTVTDANGCTFETTVVVNTPNQLVATAVPTDAACNGEASGSIDVTVTGGTAPYIFIWSGGLAQNEDQSNLLADDYTVIVQDADGCSVVAAATIGEPAAITASHTFVEATCNTSNGSIDLTVNGGVTPYTFVWDNGADPTEDPQGLAAGNYNVVITDGNGCTFEYTAGVATPTALALSTSENDASCNGEADGSIDLTVSGGTAPFTYLWSNTSPDEDISNLVADSYSVTVTDNDGCEVTATVVIDEPDILEVFEGGLPNAVSCNGGNDGEASMTVNGGTPGYTFDWSVNAFDGQQEPTGMSAGTYGLTVTDLNGCTATTSIEIVEPDPIELSVSTVPTDCFAGSNGSIDLNVIGGTAPYTYNWNSGAYVVQDPSGITAGPYNVLVTDMNGCTATTTALIDQPTQLVVSIDEISSYGGFNLTCWDATDGTADVSGTGGTAPYSFTWSNGANGESVDNLAAGTYTVVITDNNGCNSEEQVSLIAPTSIDAAFFADEPSCYGENDGQILIDTIIGGTAPYLVAINDQAFSAANQFNGLVSDNYQVMVQDANGCEWADELVVDQPSELTVDLGMDDVIQLGDSIKLEPESSVANVFALDTFIWRQGLVDYSPVVKPTETSEYSILIVDEFGCVAEDEILIRVDKKRLVYIPNAFTPNGDGNNDYFNIGVGTGVKVVKSFQVYTRWGEVMFQRSNFLPAFEEEGWDGNFRDEPMNPAVFVYFAEIEFVDGRVELYQGDVTLTR